MLTTSVAAESKGMTADDPEGTSANNGCCSGIKGVTVDDLEGTIVEGRCEKDGVHTENISVKGKKV